jgi:hypothetical protein
MTTTYRNVQINADGTVAGEISRDGDHWIGFMGRQDLLLIQQAIGRSREAAAAIWLLQDGYGPAGTTPSQGFDWSGIRDSSDEAIASMAAVAATVVSRADFLAALGLPVTKADLISADELAALDRTPIAPRPDGRPMRCVRCRKELPTEGDFARHFVIPDPRLLNTGWCPNRPRGG